MAVHPLTAEETLARLEIEQMLNQFYHHSTSNIEKKRLECKLNQMRTTTFTWQYCLDNLNTFNNQYLWFFGSSTLEATVYKWGALSKDDKERLRGGLMKLLSSYQPDTPTLHREKIAQILAMVASLQFPAEYPEYIEHVVLLLKQQFHIGLALARALGDSMTLDKEIRGYDQQVLFKNAVLPYIPLLLNTLEPFCKYYLSGADVANCQAPSGSTLWMIELLQLLQQYFSWIQLSHVEPSLVEILVQLAMLPHETEERVDVAIAAISALTELYYRQQALSTSTAKPTVSGIMALLRQPGLQVADEIYQEKLGDLVRLCLERELMFKNVTSWDEFFDLTFMFTFEARFASAFLERLGTWNMLLRWHADRLPERVNQGAPQLSEGLVLKVAINTLERMLHQNDAQHQLDKMDDDEVDDNLETEIQHYYNRCAEVVEIAAEIAPERTFELVVSPLLSNNASPFGQVLHILKTICATPDSALAELCKETNECQLRDKFRDFVSLGQVLNRLCKQLYGKVGAMHEMVGWLQREHAEVFTVLSDSVQPVDLLYVRMPPGLYREMIAVTSQILKTLKSLLQLVDTNSPPGKNVGLTDEQMLRLMAQVMKYLTPPAHVNQAQWCVVAGAAASFLLHVSAQKLMNGCTLFELMQGSIITSRLTHLDDFSAHTIRKAVCHCLLSPWLDNINQSGFVVGITASSSSAMMDTTNGFAVQRRKLLHDYICFLAHDLLCVDVVRIFEAPTLEQLNGVAMLSVELAQLTDLLTYFRHTDSAAKGMLVDPFHRIITQVYALYVSAQSKLTTCLISDRPNLKSVSHAVEDFCYAAIDSLQVQLGESCLQQLIQLFLTRARAEAVKKQHMRSFEALLGMFVLIVEQPGNQSLVADIIVLCIDDVLPVAFSEDYQSKPYTPQSELCGPLIRLFHALLLHRWNYFVKPQRLLQTQQQQPTAAMATEHQYTAILNSYGQIISTMRDSQLVVCVLESLQTLHDRYQLFREPIFAERYLASFLYAMLTVLVSDFGVACQELLVTLLFEFARIDPCKCAEIVANVCPTAKLELRNQLSYSTDLPSFTRHMKQFVAYARCAVLPPTAGGTSHG